MHRAAVRVDVFFFWLFSDSFQIVRHDAALGLLTFFLSGVHEGPSSVDYQAETADGEE